MKWLEETMATRRSLAEIGLLTVVREVFGGKVDISSAEAYDTLGQGWAETAERLRKDGLIRMRRHAGRVAIIFVAPGDRKRERSRKAIRLARARARFEKGLAERGPTIEGLNGETTA